MYDTTKKILAVDDDASNLTMINGILKDVYQVYLVSSGEEALQFLEKQRPDLILLDLDMPEMSGIDLMKILKADTALCDIPIIFLTVMSDTESEAYALELGAVDYIHKPFNSVIIKARVKLHLELESYRKELQTLVEKKTSEVLLLQKTTIDLLACINEYRDNDTGNHVNRTVSYVCLIMDNLPRYAPESYQISEDYYDKIKKSTPLHDIGKISVSDSILLKPGLFTEHEYEIMKRHVTSGAELLQNAIDRLGIPSFLDVALEMVLTHHEKWNGTGYPNRLKGEEIPISGRIMAIADAYDAITSRRPYKQALPHNIAVNELVKNSGTHFDPALIHVFTSIQEEIRKVSAQYILQETYKIDGVREIYQSWKECLY